jgi:hypothetical protein
LCESCTRKFDSHQAATRRSAGSSAPSSPTSPTPTGSSSEPSPDNTPKVKLTLPPHETRKCYFCAIEQARLKRTGELLHGEAFAHSKHADLRISGETDLGSKARFRAGDRWTVNHSLTFWFNDRLQQFAVERNLDLPPLQTVRNQPDICYHHRDKFVSSPVGMAIGILEKKLKYLEQRYVGNAQRQRFADREWHFDGVAQQVAPSPREDTLNLAVFYALRSLYRFERMTFGAVTEHFIDALPDGEERVLKNSDRKMLFQLLRHAGVVVSGFDVSRENAVLCVPAFAPMQIQTERKHARDSIKPERCAKIVGRAMKGELDGYAQTIVERRAAGAFDSTTFDLQAELAHAAGAAPITHHVLRMVTRCKSTVGADKPPAPQPVGVRGVRGTGDGAVHRGRTDELTGDEDDEDEPMRCVEEPEADAASDMGGVSEDEGASVEEEHGAEEEEGEVELGGGADESDEDEDEGEEAHPFLPPPRVSQRSRRAPSRLETPREAGAEWSSSRQ